MQHAVELVNKKGLTLRGMLHTPDSLSEGEKTKIVVMFHGFTGHKLEGHRFFWKISKALELSGIASLRFDFSGSGESDGEFQDVTVNGEISDAYDILNYAGQLPFVIPDHIYCLGFSLGGFIAGAVSAKKSDVIKKVALLAPAGHQMLSMVRQVVSQLSPDVPFADWNANVIGRALADDLETIDPYENIADYPHPVIIIHGTKDLTVPYQIGEQYKSLYGENAELVLIEGADHTFAKKDWEEAVITHLTQFFSR